MGTSKALLTIDGRRQVDRTVATLNQLRPLLGDTVVSGRVPALDSIPDLGPARGPVGGIETVARHFLGCGLAGLLVVPVDLPRLTADCLRPLLEAFVRRRPGAVCFDGLWLPALFSLNEDLVDQCGKNGSVLGLLNAVDALTLALPSDSLPLSNANTPEQWRNLVETPALGNLKECPR